MSNSLTTPHILTITLILERGGFKSDWIINQKSKVTLNDRILSEDVVIIGRSISYDYGSIKFTEKVSKLLQSKMWKLTNISTSMGFHTASFIPVFKLENIFIPTIETK